MRLEIHEPGSLAYEQVRRVMRDYRLLHPDVCRTDVSEDRIEKLQRHACSILAISSDGTVAGFVFFYCNDDTRVAFITSIARLSRTLPGVGHLLHAEYQRLAAVRGMSRSRLEVAKSNARALAFYRKQGYAVYEERAHSFMMEKPITGGDHEDG